jgi:hypothetical protein
MKRRTWLVVNAFAAVSIAIAAACGSDSSDSNNAAGASQGCTAGLYRCDGGALQVCNASGSAFETVTTCLLGCMYLPATDTWRCREPQDDGGGTGGAGGKGGSAGSAGAAAAGGAAGGSGVGGSSPDAGGSAGVGGGDGGDAASCITFCATEASLNCSNPDSACVSKCNTSQVMTPWCTALVAELYRCLASQPSSSFECGANGRPKPVHGTCDSQQQAARTCLYSGPVPDNNGICTAWCQAQTGLACAESNCMASCLDVTSTEPCPSAQASWILCASTQTLQCDSENDPALVTPDACKAQTDLELVCFIESADGGI